MSGQSESVGTASAPASSANIGPGFDAVALAFEIRCVCKATLSDRWLVAELGTEFEPQPHELVRRAMAAAVGERPVRLEIDNAIPRSRGLGSSSAVAVAAAAAAQRAFGREPSSEELFAIANELEGHPDNAAAAVYGGLVVASGDVMRQLPLAPNLVFIAAIPDEKLSTHKARAALPAQISHAAAARSVARALMLIEGLRTGDPEPLRSAAGDELHELPRAELSPVTADLIVAAYDAGAFHAGWSGAGPSTLAITDEAGKQPVIDACTKLLDDRGLVTELDVATDGWR
ncbi:MAG TPA: homoserine kinase [Acidimicrobiia bacterium]|jgi:homoserine kinase|nr:homoserine kinase [Acidimicrobiia bacterium]